MVDVPEIEAWVRRFVAAYGFVYLMFVGRYAESTIFKAFDRVITVQFDHGAAARDGVRPVHLNFIVFLRSQATASREGQSQEHHQPHQDQETRWVR